MRNSYRCAFTHVYGFVCMCVLRISDCYVCVVFVCHVSVYMCMCLGVREFACVRLYVCALCARACICVCIFVYVYGVLAFMNFSVSIFVSCTHAFVFIYVI